MSKMQMGNNNIAIMGGEEEEIKQNYLSLKDFCPKWSNYLDKRRKQSTLHLPIPLSNTWFQWWPKVISCSECIVGEAHGFSPFYNCDEYYRFADNFSLYFYAHSTRDFQHTIQKFVEHWNENQRLFHV